MVRMSSSFSVNPFRERQGIRSQIADIGLDAVPVRRRYVNPVTGSDLPGQLTKSARTLLSRGSLRRQDRKHKSSTDHLLSSST